MKNMVAILTATAVMALVAPAYAATESAQNKSKVEYKDNGGYESTRTSEHTTPGGTKHTSESKVDVDVDSDGKIDKTVKTESVTDPKGLMNKETDTAKTEIKEKERGGYVQTTVSKSTDADGTNVTIKATTDVDVDADGNVTTTAKSEKTVDPKGLMNKKTTSSMTKSVNGHVVEEKKKSN